MIRFLSFTLLLYLPTNIVLESILIKVKEFFITYLQAIRCCADDHDHAASPWLRDGGRRGWSVGLLY